MTLCKLSHHAAGIFHLQIRFCSLSRWSELGDVTREVGHLLAFATGERKDAHSRGL